VTKASKYWPSVIPRVGSELNLNREIRYLPIRTISWQGLAGNGVGCCRLAVCQLRDAGSSRDLTVTITVTG
jgi:hypothetical protein